MKTVIIKAITVLILPFLFTGPLRFRSANQEGYATGEPDWPAFMRQHDMIFDRLPNDWTGAPHFGNAMVGSMLYRDGNTIRLQIFRADVHDHRDDTWGWTAYSRPRLMIGYFSLEPVGRLVGCHWRKDLWNAELTGSISTDRGEIRIRHLTHSDDMAIVTELTPSAGEEGYTWSWHPAPARTTRGGYPATEADIPRFARAYGEHYLQTLKPFRANPPGRLEKRGEVSVWIQDLLAGGRYATAWGEQKRKGTSTFLVTIANSYPDTTAAKTAVGDIRRFERLDRKRWIHSHRQWWHAYYRQSYLSIPDKKLESLYWQNIYRFGCISRTGRSFVDTPGLWFQGESWPYFTTDWNIQSAHWPVYAANRLDQGQELVNRLYEWRDNLVKAVRPIEWQSDCAYLPLAVAGDLAGSRDGDMRYWDLVGDLPWALENAWLQYRYSMDDNMLREKIYPLLRKSVNLYLRMVEKGDDGKWHLPPTYSPESGVFEDCNFDLSLFRWGCLTLIKACGRLGIDDPLLPRWREVASNLPDFPADSNGFMLGRNHSSSANHQHLSNLLMIYPLYLVNADQPANGQVLERSLERALNTAGPDNRQAMVMSHAGPIATALGRGDAALECLKRLQDDLYPNGLWYDPPCIESTLAAANIIQDMLIQSWSDPESGTSGPIRVFPAAPSTWKDIEFHDLRAEGAFLVSARRTNGHAEWIRIKSLAGEPCRILTGMEGELKLSGNRSFHLKKLPDGTCSIDLKKGEEILITK
jgi:alpha-L-fucosidase 2